MKLKTRPYFDTDKGKFIIFTIIESSSDFPFNLPLLMYVEDENNQLYLCSICDDGFNDINSGVVYPSYILTPISQETFIGLDNGEIMAGISFLHTMFGYRITSKDEYTKDEIFGCNPSDPKFRHIPNANKSIVNAALPF